ncbi:hypothetical protein [Sphingomonas sp.]|uniref:hypothetical protein n=1 Tax=Sphingomonas sp. TaxID=28214 RepID=UPI001EB77B63|nr:hypothetical protein [Sphingomonas sp.]MBX3595585.1 hypothetical protein [Sphingomonas sp.]
MREPPSLASGLRSRTVRADLIVAVVLAVILTACWAVRDWAQLAWLNLPDNDDMMRLAQVRDWIAGQAFNDWTQYRVAPPAGGPMHWSRINDVGIAAIIVALRPLVGAYGAELAAVIAYPAMLFAAYLFLSARIARRLGGDAAGPVAAIVAALAYPANSLFLPGRIDHHALQIVLTLVAALALMRRPDARGGGIFGVAAALSLGIGLETAPHVAALVLVLGVRWIRDGRAEAGRLAAAGVAMGGVTLLLLAVARPTLWSDRWCDSFTPASTSVTLAAAGGWIALALLTARLPDWRARTAAGAVAGGAVAAFALLRYPACLAGPYGPMDPFLKTAFLDHIVEAQGLFDHRALSMGIPSAGLIFAAVCTAIWFLWRRPLRRDLALPLVALLATGAVITIFQVRGAYLGSAVAAPFLAQLIVAARGAGRARGAAVAGAWIASAGMLYLMVPERIDRLLAPQVHASLMVHKSCNGGDTWHQLDRYPAGVVMAPMDRAAYIVGGSHHASVGAGYHRSNRGNRAMYDFFLSPPDAARTIGARWKVRYVAICPGDFAEIEIATAYPDSLGAHLLRGAAPAWLEPLPLRDTGLRFYRVR